MALKIWSDLKTVIAGLLGLPAAGATHSTTAESLPRETKIGPGPFKAGFCPASLAPLGLPRPRPKNPADLRHRPPRPHGLGRPGLPGHAGVEEEAQERGYAVMLGRTGAKSAFIAGYLRTLRTYRAPASSSSPR
jgi:hypothetical protein